MKKFADTAVSVASRKAEIEDMTRIHAINLLTLEHLWFSVPRAHWRDNAHVHAALEWSVCWDSIKILNYRHLRHL